jgi:rubrerythrin
LSTAKGEGSQQAVWSFNVANRVEQVHAKLFAKASEQLVDDKQLTQINHHVCSVCGNTVEVQRLCRSLAAMFFRVA